MIEKIGRNDPCPCGSGRKYKKCCLPSDIVSSAAQRPQFRFESGSYGGAADFVPSIACLRNRGSDEWQYHFVLVRPEEHFADEDEATKMAQLDLDTAFTCHDLEGFAIAVAASLREAGYLRVDDYDIVGDAAPGPVEPADVAKREPGIPRGVRYRRGFVNDLSDLRPCYTTELNGEDLPESVLRAIEENDLVSAGGTHGDPLVGEPMQVDELTVEYDDQTVEITVYNRAIMLFKTNEDIYPRVHRVCCQIELVDPSPISPQRE